MLQRLACFVLLMLLPILAMARWPIQIPQPPVPVLVEIAGRATDPINDTFAEGPDIVHLYASTTDNHLSIWLNLAQPIIPGGMDLAGGIAIDINRKGTSGDPANLMAIFCPRPVADFGPEFEIDLFNIDWQRRTAPVLALPNLIPVGMAEFNIRGRSLRFKMDNTLIHDDGIVNLGAIVGTAAEPTDCSPDGAVLTSRDRGGNAAPVPTLGAGHLLLLILAVGITAYLSGRQHWNKSR